MHLVLLRNAPLSEEGKTRESGTFGKYRQGVIWCLQGETDKTFIENYKEKNLQLKHFLCQICAFPNPCTNLMCSVHARWRDQWPSSPYFSQVHKYTLNSVYLCESTKQAGELISLHLREIRRWWSQCVCRRILNKLHWLSNDCSHSPVRLSSQLTPNEFSAETIRYQPCKTRESQCNKYAW